MTKKKVIWGGCTVLVLAVIAGVLVYQRTESPVLSEVAGREARSFQPRILPGREKGKPEVLDLSPEVLSVIDPDAAGKRMVRTLPDTLSATDRRGIYHYLKNGPNDDQEYTIKNDLMNKLRNQKEFPTEFPEVLMELVQDRTQNMTVRIYALQHLRPMYEQTGDAKIRDLFYQALDETENEIAGGALLALRRLLNDYPTEFDNGLVSRKAAEIAANPAANDLTRTSAVQVASMLGRSEEIAPTLRSLASSAEVSLTLRLSAIAGLGSLGDPGDRLLLEELASAPGPESRAARAALMKLQSI